MELNSTETVVAELKNKLNNSFDSLDIDPNDDSFDLEQQITEIPDESLDSILSEDNNSSGFDL